MSNDNGLAKIGEQVLESIVLRGDLSGLSPTQRARFYVQTCEALGLNPHSQPFAYLKLNGKEVLYATRGATDQLAAMHKLNREIIDGPKIIDLAGTKVVYCVARATHPNGRIETATATVPFIDPVNVLMKCETKSKRRVTLSILGLGVLDETEVETIPAQEKELTAQVTRADIDAVRGLPSGAVKSPSIADLDNVGRPIAPKSEPPHAQETAPADVPTVESDTLRAFKEDVAALTNLARAVEVWLKNRTAIGALHKDERAAAWDVLAAKASEIGEMPLKNAKTWLKTEISRRDNPPPDHDPPTGTDGPARPGAANDTSATSATSTPVAHGATPASAPQALDVVDAPDARSDGGDDLSTRAARRKHLGTKHHERAVEASYAAHPDLPGYLDDCTARLTEIEARDGTRLSELTARKRLVDARNRSLTKPAQSAMEKAA